MGELRKWFCKCILPSGETVYLVIRAITEGQASKLVHEGYCIEYVEDILSPLQMEYLKRHLRPNMMGLNSLI